MIGRTNCGAGGGGKISIPIFGAKNETVSFSGASSGTVTLNENGIGSVELKSGSYVFTGGISGYSTTVTVDKTTAAIYVRPVRTLYWYGAFGDNVSFITVKQWGYTYAENENDITFTWDTSATAGTANNGTFFTPSEVDFSGATSLKAKISVQNHHANASTPKFGYYNAVNTSAEANPNVYASVPFLSDNQASDVVVALKNTSGFPGVRCNLASVQVYAIWLE